MRAITTIAAITARMMIVRVDGRRGIHRRRGGAAVAAEGAGVTFTRYWTDAVFAARSVVAVAPATQRQGDEHDRAGRDECAAADPDAEQLAAVAARARQTVGVDDRRARGAAGGARRDRSDVVHTGRVLRQRDGDGRRAPAASEVRVVEPVEIAKRTTANVAPSPFSPVTVIVIGSLAPNVPLVQENSIACPACAVADDVEQASTGG